MDMMVTYEAQMHDTIRYQYGKILKFKIRYGWDEVAINVTRKGGIEL